MFVHLYFAKHFSARAAGSRIEQVCCEKCNTVYFYELSRIGHGRADAPYYFGQSSANIRAHSDAQKDLAKRLDRDIELVPCPKCNWVNEELVEIYRRSRFKQFWTLVIALVIVCAAVGGVAFVLQMQEVVDEAKSRGVILAAAMTAAFGPVGLMLIRNLLRRRINPNPTYPNPPIVPLGTPPALVIRQDGAGGETYLEPAAKENVWLLNDRWAIFRAGQSCLLPICAVCLDRATTTYRPRLALSTGESLAAPICQSCKSRAIAKWWLCMFLVIAVVTIGVYASMRWWTGLDEIGRWAMFGSAVFLGSLIGGIIIPTRLCRVVTLRKVDARRGVYKFAARNSEYTRRLAECYVNRRVSTVAQPPTVESLK